MFLMMSFLDNLTCGKGPVDVDVLKNMLYAEGSVYIVGVFSQRFDRYRRAVRCYYFLPRLGKLVGKSAGLKGCEFESRQERREKKFFSRLTVCALIRCLFHPRVTAVGHKIPRSLLPKVQVAGYT